MPGCLASWEYQYQQWLNSVGPVQPGGDPAISQFGVQTSVGAGLTCRSVTMILSRLMTWSVRTGHHLVELHHRTRHLDGSAISAE